MDTIVGNNLPKEGDLRNAAVLYLNIPEAVKLLLVGISKHAKGIKETEKELSANIGLGFVQGVGGHSHMGQGGGGGRSSKEGGDGKIRLNVLNL